MIISLDYIGIFFIIFSKTIFINAHSYLNTSCGYDIKDCTELQAKKHKKYFTGSGICSHNHKFQLGITWDGDLCICNDKKETVWCAEISIENKHDNNVHMVMQGDGNLVVYDATNVPRITLWSSRTQSHKGSRLRLKNKGVAVIYSPSSKILWSTNEALFPVHQSPKLPTVKPPVPSRPTNTDSEQFTLYVLGDTPYSHQDFQTLRKRIASLPDDAEALVHVGDIKAGGAEECSLSHYTKVSQELDKSPAPVFILPGDNDANDCPDFDTSWNHWTETFLSPTNVTESKWNTSHFGVIRRPLGSADFAFVYKGSLVLGVDVTGGVPHDRKEWKTRHNQSVNWLMDQINEYVQERRSRPETIAILILGHGRPQDSNKDFFISLRSRMRKNSMIKMDRVLYVHGDGHKPMSHKKYGFRCVQVDLGRRKWLKLSIKSDHSKPMTYTHGIFVE